MISLNGEYKIVIDKDDKMNYKWLDEYCKTKKGVERDFKEEWNATRYRIKGKMFAMQGGDKENKPIITMKLKPDYGQVLRETYVHIVPGYYMNKTHWNSLYLDGDVPDDVLRDMIDEAYQLVFESLSKKVRVEILESNNGNHTS